MGSLEWIESIKGTDTYTEAVKIREIRSTQELQEAWASIVEPEYYQVLRHFFDEAEGSVGERWAKAYAQILSPLG